MIRSTPARRTRSAAACLLLSVLAATEAAAQSTWVVDDDPGPGVDFADIAAALAVAGPFDLVEVRPGDYGPFTRVRPTRILGAPRARVSGTSRVEALPAGTWTWLAALELDALHGRSVHGTLLLDRLTLQGTSLGGTALDFSDCRDVRANAIRALPRLTGGGAKVRISGGLVQLLASEIEGDGAPAEIGAVPADDLPTRTLALRPAAR